MHGNKYLQSTLVEAAWGATRTKDSFLKRKYESLVGRRGKKKALVAVGHKIIVAAYFIIQNKETYETLMEGFGKANDNASTKGDE